MDQDMLILYAMFGFAMFIGVFFMILAVLDRRRDKAALVKRIRELEEQVKTYRDLLGRTEEKYRQELKRLAGLSEVAKSILQALDEGVVKLVHREDNGEVIVLQDGTLVCKKERLVIWPVEKPVLEEEVALDAG